MSASGPISLEAKGSEALGVTSNQEESRYTVNNSNTLKLVEAVDAGTAFEPKPVGPYVESRAFGAANQTYGGCAKFCALAAEYGKRRGWTVDEHGPWCESEIRGYLPAYSQAGAGLTLTAGIVDRYFHGEYADSVKINDIFGNRYIRLDVHSRGSEVPDPVYLSVGDALRMANALSHLVAEADDLNTTVRTAA